MKKQTLIFLLSGFLFFSCTNLFNDNSDSPSTVTFKGTIEYSGAVPYEFMAAGNSEAETSRSASFTPDSSWTYFVQATSGNDKVSGTFGTGNASKTFELALAAGKTWTITCGLNDDEKTLLSDSFTTTTSIEEPVLSHTFFIKPGTEGNGAIDLTISVPEKVTSIAAVCREYAWVNLNGDYGHILPLDSNNKIATFRYDVFPSGTYEFTFNFYYSDSDNNILLYTTTQTINVFDHLTTNRWYSSSSSSTDSPISNSNGAFTLTEKLIKKQQRTTFYVGNTSLGQGSDDSGNGSAYAPLESISKACDIIAKNNDTSASYRIFVCGKITGKQEIPAAIDGHAGPITIQGYKGLDSKGDPQDILDGNNQGTTLTVNTTNVPVIVRDLMITGGSGTDGGGIYNKGKLTLGNGCLVKGNTVTNNGGGIYNDSSKLVLNGARIEENTAVYYGGGIYNNNTQENTIYVYGNTNIKNNKTTSTGLGYGGAIYNSTAIYFGFNENKVKTTWRGEISGNTAISGSAIWTAANSSIYIDSGTIQNNNNSYYWGILLMGTATLEMSGSAKIAPSTPVYYCPYGAQKILPNFKITGALTGPAPVATIILNPDSWTRGTTIAVADGTNVTDLTPYKDYFAFTNSDWGTKVSGDKESLLLDSPFYVSGAETHPVTGKAGSDSNSGTKSSPLATISKACSFMNNKDTEYTIIIDGELNGAQTIPNTLSTETTSPYKAQSVTIQGASGNTVDILNGGFSSSSNGTTLTIKSTVPVTIKDLKITGGYATQTPISGGGIYNKGDLTLSQGALVSGNYTLSCGGGIYNLKTLTIESGAEISDNHEKGNTGCAGGGIFNHKGTVMISGGVIKSNSADHDGGAIYNEDGTVYIYGDTLIGKEVSSAPTSYSSASNYANNGGAICVNGGTVYLGYKNNNGTAQKDDSANVRIMGNAGKPATSKGGAVYVEAGTLQVAKTCIGFNYCSYGAGIYTKGTVSLLEDAVVKGNNAFNQGGGVHVDQGGKLNMTSNSIIGGSESGNANTAAYGGGVYVSSSSSAAGKEAIVTFGVTGATVSPSISGNSAKSYGGGIYIDGFGATVNMHSGTISNNKVVTGTIGGGIYVIQGGTLNMEGGTISGNYIDNNSTSKKGGAINVNTSGNFKIKGTVSIPYGGETGKNDVYMQTSDPIKITGAITLPEGVTSVATIIPYSYTDAILALSSSPSPTTTLAAEVGKFRIIPKTGETPLGTGLERGLDGDGKYSDNTVVVVPGDNDINDVRDAIMSLISGSTDNVNICFTEDFNPKPINAEAADYYNKSILKINSGKIVMLSASQPVTISANTVLNPDIPLVNNNCSNVIIVDGGSLTLGENIIIDGRKPERFNQDYGVRVINGGSVTLDGAKITKCDSDGGGVYVLNNGTVTIKGNTEIYGNSVTGVVINGANAKLIMEGGSIYNNTDNAGETRGGGVLVLKGAKFIKTGGSIYGNQVYYQRNSQVYFYTGGGYYGSSESSLTSYANDTRWDSASEIP